MKINLGLLILRVSIGLSMLLLHGWPKLINFTAMSAKFPDPIGVGTQASLALAVFAEFFCSVALILGALTRWVSVPLIITMLVAFFQVHGGAAISERELPLMYIIAFGTLIFTGGGAYGLDTVIRRNR